MNKDLVVGSINMDMVFTTASFPALGETLSGQRFNTFHGGKGANQAVAARRLGAEVAMIASAMACPGAVLICWVHENIAHIARQIPVSTATPVPEAWPNDAQGNGRFDLVWLFEYDNAVDAYRFAEIPQFLLDGDLPV